MDRIWQWTWDRCGPTYYVWPLCAAAFVVALPIYFTLVSLPIVAFEKASSYFEATAVTVVAVALLVCMMVLPNFGWAQSLKQWGAGHVDRATALEATYIYVRTAPARVVWTASSRE